MLHYFVFYFDISYPLFCAMKDVTESFLGNTLRGLECGVLPAFALFFSTKNTATLFPSTRPIRRKVMADTVSSERPCDGTAEPFRFRASRGFCVMSMVGTATVTAMNRRQGDGRPADGSARRVRKGIDGGKVTARELEEEKEREQERRREVN